MTRGFSFFFSSWYIESENFLEEEDIEYISEVIRQIKD